MTHARQQLRERVATDVTGLTTTGSRVYQSRIYNLEKTDLPCLLVYSKNEDSERDTFKGTNGLARNLSIVIEGYQKGASDLDDSLDTIAEEVEAALGADPTLNGLAKDSSIVSTDIEYTGDGETPIGLVRMTFNVNYRTTTTAPGTAI